MISPELRHEIIVELRKVRAPSKVARNLGVDIRLVLSIADNLPCSVREERFGGWGRPEIRNFAVARKRVHDRWDNSAPAIAGARNAYGLGTHDMATGRDGDWLILYSIPQRRRTPRPDYFRSEV